jgi:hypothetical protein
MPHFPTTIGLWSREGVGTIFTLAFRMPNEGSSAVPGNQHPQPTERKKVPQCRPCLFLAQGVLEKPINI